MKVLIVGDWHSELHEQAVFDAMLSLGHDSGRFSWHQYFQAPNRLAYAVYRAQYKYMAGPLVDRINADLLARARTTRPDLIFVYRGTHIYARTLARLRYDLPGTVLIGYNNDDPFSPQYPRWMWRHFKAGIPHYDLVLAYRHHNLAEYRAAGARRVELLRSWFIPERNHPVDLTPAQRELFGCDVVFVGHYEADGRLEYLEEIARRGWSLRIFGPGRDWEEPLSRSALLAKHLPIRFVSGDAYNLSLAGAKLALCFFSKLNRDTYTRRCFEIPASGTVLLSAFTEDVASLYDAGTEAVFFRSVTEMAGAAEGLLTDEPRRRQIAKAGTKRAWQDGHDVVSRMKTVIGWAEAIASGRQ